ncbi:MAG: hypothetical protein HY094_01690 [Candidatus Melainabacteria bacterium]|nr:hypothetical protein [Candidatus Melainabacteria bacterium]
MSSKPKKRKKNEEDDWIYDPIVVKSVLRAKKEMDEILKKGGHLTTMEELLEKFHKEDAKKIYD